MGPAKYSVVVVLRYEELWEPKPLSLSPSLSTHTHTMLHLLSLVDFFPSLQTAKFWQKIHKCANLVQLLAAMEFLG